MEKPKHLALIVARRQKRLQYWQQRFAGSDSTAGIEAERAKEIKEKLSTYGLLLSKLSKSGSADQVQDSENRIQALERELTSLFESRRLMTSEIGGPVTGGFPER